MPQPLLPDVARLPLFERMDEGSLGRLMRRAHDLTVPAHTRLIAEGDPSDFLHILVSGLVELYGTTAGRSATMAVLRPVSTFILAASIRNAPYLMSAVTLERSRVVMVPSADLREALVDNPALACAALRELAIGYRGMVRHAKNLKLRSTRERLAAYFLRQSRILGGADSYSLPVERRRLASYLGMTPENLSRAVRSLGADGCRIEGQRVIITDRAALEAVAQLSVTLDGPDQESVASGLHLPPAVPDRNISELTSIK